MKRLTLLAFGLCLSLSTLMAQKISLTFNPEKGATYEYDYVMKQKITQLLLGQEVITNQNMSFIYAMNVLEKNKKNVRVSFTYKRAFYEMQNPMINIRYDSENPVQEEEQGLVNKVMADIYGSLLNKQFEAVIAVDGTVESITGMAAIIDEMERVAGNYSQSLQVREMMEKMMGDEALKKSFEQSMKIYPQGKVGVGDTWTIEQAVDAMDISMLNKNTYLLEAMDKKTVTLKVDSDVEGNAINGKQKGQSILNRKTGLPEYAELQQNFSGKIAISEMEVGIVIDSELIIKTREVK